MILKHNKNATYQGRNDLTPREVLAINHYKDLVNPQYAWDFQPKKEDLEKAGIDCFIVNAVLRGKISKSKLSKRDLNHLNKIIHPLSSAIRKSRIMKNTLVMKGLFDSSWIEGLKEGDVFNEPAFGSFTTSREIADSYAKENKCGKKVLIYRELHIGDRALFVDNDESEYILPKGKKYLITHIDNFQNEIIYYVSEAYI